MTSVLPASHDAPRSIFIPVQGSTEGVEIFVDELPADVNDLIDVLKAEMAPLEIWLQFAVEFHKQGRQDAFLQILREGSDPVVEEYYNDAASRLARTKILNTLAAHCTKSMLKEKKKDELKQAAFEYFNRADRIDHMFEMTWVGKGVMYLSTGELKAAQYQLDNALQQHRENLPAILGKACIAFKKGRYLEARRDYKEAIVLNPKCPNASNLRFMFGVCCYKLGQFEKAKDAMKRALELNPSNVEAMAALALFQLAATDGSKEQRKQRIERGLQLFSQAYTIDSNQPLVLNHLANHYFWKWVRIPGVVTVEQGSSVVASTDDLRAELSAGSWIRVGENFTTTVAALLTDRSLKLSENYSHSSATDVPIYKKDYQRTVQLATNAYHLTEVPDVRSESCYLMGRALHADNKYKEAYEQYFNAIRNSQNKEFVLPYYGLGQTYIHEQIERADKRVDKLEKAAECFEKVLARFPESRETLLVLGWVYSQTKKRDQALQFFRRVTELRPTDIQAQLEIAQLLQQQRQDGGYENALASYLRVEQLLSQKHQKVEPQLLNNVAVLHHQLGNLGPAESYYMKAINADGEERGNQDGVEESKDGDDEDEKEAVTSLVSDNNELLVKLSKTNVTICYNVARLYEAKGLFAKAEIVYSAIVSKFPTYTDCQLRLAHIAKGRGQIDEAHKRYSPSSVDLAEHYADCCQSLQKALEAKPGDEDVLSTLGNLHLEKNEWAPAQKYFEQILAKRKHDAYSCLSMGNIFLANLDERGKFTKYLDLAKDYYRKVLSLEPSNIYAANGLGIVLAEKGHIDEALEVFNQIREADPDIPDIWVNLGHLYLAKEKYVEAVQMYQTGYRKAPAERKQPVLVCLAHAYFLSRQFPQCISTLSTALGVSPKDLKLWYNMALAQEESAVTALQKTKKRTLAEVERAVEDLQNAMKTFAWLVMCLSDLTGNPPFDKTKCEKHVIFCRENLDKAQVHLQHERREEEKRQALMEEQERKVREQREKLEQERMQKQLEEEEKKRTLLEAARKKEERLARLTEQWRASSVGKESKKERKGGKRRKKDEIIESDNESTGGVEDMRNEQLSRNPKMRKLLKKRGRKGKASSDNEDNNGESSSGAEEGKDDFDEKELFGTDSSDDESESDSGRKGKATAASEKIDIMDVKKMFGSDSDDSDDDDDNLFGPSESKADAGNGTASGGIKRKTVVDDDDDDDDLFKDDDTSQAAPVPKKAKIDDDDD